ncbi:hypothetical protein ACTXT7_005057 [Hymenolepis weldensis]
MARTYICCTAINEPTCEVSDRGSIWQDPAVIPIPENMWRTILQYPYIEQGYMNVIPQYPYVGSGVQELENMPQPPSLQPGRLVVIPQRPYVRPWDLRLVDFRAGGQLPILYDQPGPRQPAMSQIRSYYATAAQYHQGTEQQYGYLTQGQPLLAQQYHPKRGLLFYQAVLRLLFHISSQLLGLGVSTHNFLLPYADKTHLWFTSPEYSKKEDAVDQLLDIVNPAVCVQIAFQADGQQTLSVNSSIKRPDLAAISELGMRSSALVPQATQRDPSNLPPNGSGPVSASEGTSSSPIDHDRCCIFTIQHKDLNSLHFSSFFNHFKQYGWVELAVCLEKGADGFVQFHYPEHARKALKHPRHEFGATSLKLYPSDPKFFKGISKELLDRNPFDQSGNCSLVSKKQIWFEEIVGDKGPSVKDLKRYFYSFGYVRDIHRRMQPQRGYVLFGNENACRNARIRLLECLMNDSEEGGIEMELSPTSGRSRFSQALRSLFQKNGVGEEESQIKLLTNPSDTNQQRGGIMRKVNLPPKPDDFAPAKYRDFGIRERHYIDKNDRPLGDL